MTTHSSCIDLTHAIVSINESIARGFELLYVIDIYIVSCLVNPFTYPLSTFLGYDENKR
jgi:hypothetical protein